MSELQARIDELRTSGDLVLPLPGSGATVARHRALAEFGRRDLSLARIAEAHTDATAIIAQSGREPRADHVYGVWASDGPQGRLCATAQGGGGWQLNGVKQYCSGSTLVDAALVTAHSSEGLLLFDVSLEAPGLTVCPSTWVNAAFADTATQPVSFTGVTLAASALLGGPGWYLSRPGFWHGALGPAACWAGGAISLIDAATQLNKQDPHSRAQVGALLSIRWGLDAVLAQAGEAVDADPADRNGEARTRALKVRHLIERWCTEVLDRFGRATGPQLLAFDATVARQYAALLLYIRQCHAERDLESIPS